MPLLTPALPLRKENTGEKETRETMSARSADKARNDIFVNPKYAGFTGFAVFEGRDLRCKYL